MRTRVLFLAWAPFFSGAERALLLTLRSLDRGLFEPSVIVGTDGQLAREVRALDIPCDVIRLTQLDRRKPFSSGFSVARVAAAALRFRPSIIHSNDMPSYQPGGYAARLLGVPAVTHLRFPDNAKGYRWFFRPGFSLAIFISESFKAAALGEAPDVFGGRATVLYDAVELPELWTDEEKTRQRQELGLPADCPVVALTGQVSEVKGIWEFVEAADRLRSTSTHFAVLGDDLKSQGALRRQMEERVAALGLRDRFTFLGFRNNAPQLIQAFDIVTVPSHVEPFGLSSLEAMAAARPVVASRVGGIPEVVNESRIGILVPVRDAAALANGVSELLADPARARAMGVHGRRRAGETFSIAVHGQALARIYDRLLSESTPFSNGEVA